MIVWKGSLYFGFVDIPISLKKITKEGSVRFRMLDRLDRSLVGHSFVNKLTRKEVPKARLVKGFEYEKNKFVVLGKEDFSKFAANSAHMIDIESFVPLKEIHPTLFETPYALLPQTEEGEKSYYLLRTILQKKQCAGIGKVMLRTKQHLAAIVPQDDYLMLEILRFSHELQNVQDFHRFATDPNTFVVTENEMRMAEQLVDDMTESWNPDRYRNTSHDLLMEVIQQKVKKEISSEIGKQAAPIQQLLKKGLQSNGMKKVTPYRVSTQAQGNNVKSQR